jgi:membrane protein required for colicin V production
MDSSTLADAFAPLAHLGWVDWTLLAVLLVSVILGLVRGFVLEAMGLLGWVVAWFSAQWAAPVLAPHIAALGVGEAGDALPHAAGFLVVFVLALVIWMLFARLLKAIVHATPLSVPDRILGGGFGVLRGAVLLLALAMVVALTPAAQSQAWRSSQGARWLGLSLQALKPLLPEPARQLMPA